jgi:23S rRNA pseudouridine2605 synthase
MNKKPAGPRSERPKKLTATPIVEGETSSGERLQKVLALAGHGSRRACEELIVEGRVMVDGKICDKLGTRVDAATQEIRVDGVALPRQKLIYYVLNKPAGVLSTNNDPSGRARVIDLVPGERRLFTVGRLDKESEGLILVTNDGDLANRLAHPRYGVEKIYQVEVAGKPEAEQLRELRQGVHLAEALVRAEAVVIKKTRPQSTVLEITLREGRNREIRRVLARLGHKVLRLKRIALGPLRLGDMPVGSYRELNHREVVELRESSSAPRQRGGRKKSTSSGAPKKGARPTGGGFARSGKPGGASRPSAGRPSGLGRPSGGSRPGSAGRPSGAGRPGGGSKPAGPAKKFSDRPAKRTGSVIGEESGEGKKGFRRQR